jgi:hypothetical protein
MHHLSPQNRALLQHRDTEQEAPFARLGIRRIGLQSVRGLHFDLNFIPNWQPNSGSGGGQTIVHREQKSRARYRMDPSSAKAKASNPARKLSKPLVLNAILAKTGRGRIALATGDQESPAKIRPTSAKSSEIRSPLAVNWLTVFDRAIHSSPGTRLYWPDNRVARKISHSMETHSWRHPFALGHKTKERGISYRALPILKAGCLYRRSSAM